jgi:glutathione S-transferase
LYLARIALEGQAWKDFLKHNSTQSQVLEDQLKDHEWLAAEQYTIADIANFTWVYIHSWSGEQLIPHHHSSLRLHKERGLLCQYVQCAKLVDPDDVRAGASLDDKPNLKAWLDKIAARPAVQRGLDVPEKNKFKSMTKEEEEKAIAEAQKFMGSTSAPGAQK